MFIFQLATGKAEKEAMGQQELQANYKILENHTEYPKYRREYQNEVRSFCKKISFNPKKFDSLSQKEYGRLVDDAYSKGKITAEDVKNMSAAWKIFKGKMKECVEQAQGEQQEFKMSYGQTLQFYREFASLDMPSIEMRKPIKKEVDPREKVGSLPWIIENTGFMSSPYSIPIPPKVAREMGEQLGPIAVKIAKDTAKDIKENPEDLIPFVSAGKNLYGGTRKGSIGLILLGIGDGALDLVTIGKGSVVKNIGKNAIRNIGKEAIEEVGEAGAKTLAKEITEQAIKRSGKTFTKEEVQMLEGVFEYELRKRAEYMSLEKAAGKMTAETMMGSSPLGETLASIYKKIPKMRYDKGAVEDILPEIKKLSAHAFTHEVSMSSEVASRNLVFRKAMSQTYMGLKEKTGSKVIELISGKKGAFEYFKICAKKVSGSSVATPEAKKLAEEIMSANFEMEVKMATMDLGEGLTDASLRGYKIIASEYAAKTAQMMEYMTLSR